MKTKSQLFNDIRGLLGEVYSTELFNSSFLISNMNDAKNIINFFDGGKWQWAIENYSETLTTSTSELDLPSDYLSDMLIGYGSDSDNLTYLVYVDPTNWDSNTASYNQFTIKSNKIYIPALSNTTLYIKYYKRLADITNASDVGFTELPPELDSAVISYVVGMGYQKKRQFNSAENFIGIADKNYAKRSPNSFWGKLMMYASNNIQSHSKTNFAKRANPRYC
jgi:hypothetical protein